MTIKTKLFAATALIGMAFLFANFKSTRIDQYPALSKEDLTAYLHGRNSKEWKSTAFSLFGIIKTQKCRLDDKIILNQDGTFQYDGGRNLCGKEDNKRIRTGKWYVSDSGEELIFEYEKGRRRKKTERHSGKVLNAGGGWIVLQGEYRGIKLQGTYFAQ